MSNPQFYLAMAGVISGAIVIYALALITLLTLRRSKRERELTMRTIELERDSYRSVLLRLALDAKTDLAVAHTLVPKVDLDTPARVELVNRLDSAESLVHAQIDQLIQQYPIDTDDDGEKLREMLAQRHASLEALSPGVSQEDK
ncbi:hypothetical protein [Rhodococcus qingshengii]|uniref:hypothetical protein n=1 Tax=Rhodococcus qingshengii TaxID=334542 RepID=UPI002B00372E|nr:hypothetical protein [Rhodococcus qingshengii]MEA1798569.1 hypothetical protein [Rhodococcus qingshengii]